jgi:3-phosphoshikimate 1-carboxyvinyltransferase
VIAVIQPSEISGIVQAPASKSSMQRACAAALLRKGTSIIKNPGHSNDDKAAIDIIQKLGAELIIPARMTQSGGNNEEPARPAGGLIIKSEGINPIASEINCGESGLGIRMFTPIVALSDKEIVITGEGSLLKRPMNFFDNFFPKLGVSIQSNHGKLPLKIKGPLQPKNIEVDGSLSSQFITGLLLAYSVADAKNVSIKVSNLTSKPYVDLTIRVMKQFGLNVPENRNYKEFYFSAETPDSRLPTHEYTVEADWSGAAFLLVTGAIAGPITIRGLDLGSTQADKAIVDVLMSANAAIAMEAKGIKIRPAEMKAFEFDATDSPDLFPPLVALAAYCNGISRIKGVNRLIHKESNRAATLQAEFEKMGLKIELNSDEMIIHGGKGLKGATIHSHHDHRIAMACAVAALKADGETTIEEAQAVNKSYPDFFWHLKKLGADVSLPGKKFIHE